MIEPLSITASSLSVLGSIVTLTQNLATFVSNVRSARKDVDGFSSELASLKLCLESLRDETFPFPESCRAQLITMLGNCKQAVGDMEKLIAKHSSLSAGRRLEWSLSSRNEAMGLRQRLEAHKSAIELSLDLAQISMSSAIHQKTETIKADTQIIKTNTFNIAKDTQILMTDNEALRFQFEALRLEIRHLKLQDPRSGYMLDRYLADTVTYTESVLDPFEDGQALITDGISDHASDTASVHDTQESIVPHAMPNKPSFTVKAPHPAAGGTPASPQHHFHTFDRPSAHQKHVLEVLTQNNLQSQSTPGSTNPPVVPFHSGVQPQVTNQTYSIHVHTNSTYEFVRRREWERMTDDDREQVKGELKLLTQKDPEDKFELFLRLKPLIEKGGLDHGGRLNLNYFDILGSRGYEVLLRFGAKLDPECLDHAIHDYKYNKQILKQGAILEEAVEFVTRHGVDVNLRSPHRETALHYAVRNDTELIPILVKYGADLEARNGDHATPLHTALARGQIGAVKVLLESGASELGITNLRYMQAIDEHVFRKIYRQVPLQFIFPEAAQPRCRHLVSNCSYGCSAWRKKCYQLNTAIFDRYEAEYMKAFLVARTQLGNPLHHKNEYRH